MKILSFNTTGVGTQFALNIDGKAYFKDAGFSRHSETFFPLLEEFFEQANTNLNEIDVIGVVTGPGSFTGIRIGLSIAKTFAFAKNLQCVCGTSLEVLAYNTVVNNKEALSKPVCAVINAGSDLVYFQLFERKKDELIAITEPKVNKIKHFTGYIHSLYNDDVVMVYNDNNEKEKNWVDLLGESENFTPEALNLCMQYKIAQNNFINYINIKPVYLRVSQAEKLTYDEQNLVIEKGELKDIETLCEMESQDDPEDLQWSKTSLEQSFDNKSYACYILKSKEKPLGYISVIDLGEEIEILRVVVLKTARLQGVGQKLISYIFELGKKQNAKEILLEVNDHNYPALSLYQKMGFEKVGERKQYYSERENAILMKKFL